MCVCVCVSVIMFSGKVSSLTGKKKKWAASTSSCVHYFLLWQLELRVILSLSGSEKVLAFPLIGPN